MENKKSQNAEREEKILDFWKENDTFNKSLTKKSPKGNYVFYDGPPFATGLPHYGHILGSTAKDVIGRYQTMQGYRVPRKWGWDCHGLPIENIVEKDLGISGRKAIEVYGVDKFSEHARSKVLTYVSEWEKTVDRIGRWVDFKNSYKTMDNSFIESVWWALGEMNNKGLLYEGVRVLAYCTRCETPIANSEIAMDNSYKDISDLSVYVKFRVSDEDTTQKILPHFNASTLTRSNVLPTTYLLAWTTTPWTLPGNTAIAINKNIDYIFVKNSNEDKEEILIIAKNLFENLKDKFTNPEIVKEVKGEELVGLSYEPVFDYYKYADIQNKENIWKVWHADFVTSDTGTGIAHEAPAFGEDDMNLAKDHNIPFIRHVDPNGVFSKEVIDFAGQAVKPKSDDEKVRFAADIEIIKYLQEHNSFFAKEKIKHSYPHCYRCDTPLLYYALPSWFVNIQKIKQDALENAKEMNWIPSHLKEGRFKHIMDNAPDWTISRNRFWASPLPFWKNENGKMLSINSVEDLKNKTKKSGNKYFVARHGEGTHNVDGITSSKKEDPVHITEKGKLDAENIGKLMKDNDISVIYASPFVRTRETVAIVSKVLGFPVDSIVYDDRLGDIDAGDFEGKAFNWMGYFSGMKSFDEKITGGESPLDVKKRLAEFLYEIDAKHKNEKILIISHGIFFEVIDSICNGYNKEKSLEILLHVTSTIKPGDSRAFDFTPLPHNADYELDLHRPYIDDIVLVDDENVEYKRIPEVIDCWFESGSMPFAQDHYPFNFVQGKPFERKDWKENNFPAGFVAEYIAQTRTWFYYTHIIASTLFGHAPFKNVVTTGTILAEDGQKMSKSKNNFPDPWILFDKHGVDALRFYLMSSTVMKGEDVNFSEKAVQEVASKIVGRLDNVFAFYELYRDKTLENNSNPESKNLLDQWILARLDETIQEVTENMQKYEMTLATKPFELFIEDFSTWYLRRSRDRLKEGDSGAKMTLYFVIKNTVKLLAPFTPFIAEDIWQKIKTNKDEESVHLAEWPKSVESIKHKVAKEIQKIFGSKENKVLEEMEEVRNIVNQALKERQKKGIAVRQPLNELKVKSVRLKDEYIEILKDELNIKNVVFVEREEGGEKVILDFTITPELKKEGEYREILRAVQDMRKKEGLVPSDMVDIVLSISTKELVEKFMDEFIKTVGAKNVIFKDNEGEEIKIGDLIVKIKLVK